MTENNFFAYCRESIDLVSGIEIQKEVIKKYCEAYGINIIKWFIDNDYSAYKFRPGFDKMWQALDKCDGIVVKDLTRFGRDDADLLYRFNILKEKKKRIIFITEHIDNTNQDSEFFMKLLAVFADKEASRIRERLKAGREYAKIHGTKSGKPMHRPPIEMEWREYDKYYNLGLSTSAISKLIKDKRTGKTISKSCLYNLVNARKSMSPQ